MIEHNNVTISRELLRQAAELLDGAITYDWHGNPSEEFDRECNATADKLRTALEQPASVYTAEQLESLCDERHGSYQMALPHRARLSLPLRLIRRCGISGKLQVASTKAG